MMVVEVRRHASTESYQESPDFGFLQHCLDCIDHAAPKFSIPNPITIDCERQLVYKGINSGERAEQ
jgi:hypothetical protein